MRIFVHDFMNKLLTYFDALTKQIKHSVKIRHQIFKRKSENERERRRRCAYEDSEKLSNIDIENTVMRIY